MVSSFHHHDVQPIKISTQGRINKKIMLKAELILKLFNKRQRYAKKLRSKHGTHFSLKVGFHRLVSKDLKVWQLMTHESYNRIVN